MRFHTFIIIVLAVLVIGPACSTREPTQADNEPIIDRTPAQLTLNEQNLVGSASGFGFELFQQVASRTAAGNNVFISPLSASYALGMTYNGADGDTRTAMASTLHMSGLTGEEFNQAYHDLMLILGQADPAVVTNIANSIWYRDGLPVLSEFLDINRQYFKAEVSGLDFSDPQAATTINNWVNEKTNEKIPTIVDPPIPADVIMYLINAVYFKANWTYPFDKDETAAATFRLADGTPYQCQMMRMNSQDVIDTHELTEPPFDYYRGADFEAARLPYGSAGYSMTIVLPSDTTTADAVIAQLDTSLWTEIQQNLSPAPIIISLPRFKFAFKTGLRGDLIAMGMGEAFSSSADFSKMLPNGGGWIDEVLQKTFVQVDEEGTEAAAVTAVVMITSLVPALVCDRPFIVVVHEQESGAVLFMGKIAKPEWKDQ